MQLEDIFRPESFLLGLRAADKWAAIERMMEHLRATGAVPEEHASDMLDAVLARERSMSTGMEHGLAIPHAAVEGLESAQACLAVVAGDEGLSFESIDHGATHLVVLLLIPRNQKLLHIRTLANIARLLGQDEVRQRLREAGTPEEAWRAVTES